MKEAKDPVVCVKSSLSLSNFRLKCIQSSATHVSSPEHKGTPGNQSTLYFTSQVLNYVWMDVNS